MTTKNMKKLLTRDEILAVQDRKSVEVEVPEWGGTVRLMPMNGAQRDEFEAACTRIQGDGKTSVDIRGLKARLVSLCVVDDKDNLLFTANEIEALNRKNAMGLNRVFEVAQEMNGLGERSVKRALGN